MLLLPFLQLMATEHHLDVIPSLGGPKLNHHGALELDYRLVSGVEDSWLIINPRLKPHLNGSLSSALGLGARSLVSEDSMFGFFLFGGHTYIRGANLFHGGPSLEFLSNDFDLKFNAYIPINGNRKIGSTIIEAHHRLEGEFCYKTEHVHFGVAPSYDFEGHQIGAVGRIGFPVDPGMINLTFGKDATFGNFGKLSFTIASFGPKGDHASPIWRQTESFYRFKKIPKPVPRGPIIIYGQPLPEPGKELPPVVAKPDPVTPPADTPPPEWHWWDFFRRG